MTLSAVHKFGLLSNILVFALALLILCSVSCRKSVDPNELILKSRSTAPPPSAANVINVGPAPAQPASSPATSQNSPAPVESTSEPASISQRQFFRHWAMLLTVLILLFLLSLVIFHSMGRRLRHRSFKPHPPTRHADIWASHKPPEFLDP